MSDRDNPVKSPCISVCSLNEEDVCIGCFRTVSEIIGWRQMDDDERREVVRLAGRRSRERNPFA